MTDLGSSRLLFYSLTWNPTTKEKSPFFGVHVNLKGSILIKCTLSFQTVAWILPTVSISLNEQVADSFPKWMTYTDTSAGEFARKATQTYPIA